MAVNRCSVSNRMGWCIKSSPEVGEWVAARNNSKYHEQASQAIGLVKNEEIVAGVIYERYTGASLTVHIAISGQLTPAYLRAIFDYPFVFCDVNKLIAPVASTNVKSIKLVENMGFIEEGRIRDAAPDGDIIMYTMSKLNCRFINYGRR